MRRRLTLLLALLLGVELLVAAPAAATHGHEHSEPVDCDRTVPIPGYTDRDAPAGGLQFYGTSGNDRIFGTPARDVIDGVGGDDILCGFGGDDKLDGGAGNDYLYGGGGRDHLSGHSGNDHLYGGNGPDVLEGLQDNDYLDGGEGKDELDYSCTASGTDFCKLWHADPALRGGQHVNLQSGTSSGTQGNDTFTSVEVVKGSPGADTLYGRVGEVDEFLPTSGGDTLDGRGDDDNDVLYYYLFDGEQAPAEGTYLVDVDLPNEMAEHPAGTDIVRSIETVYGTAHADRLVGGDRREQLNGMGGKDLIEGNGGNDRLDGGAGNDVISGGAGNDHLLGRGGNDFLDGGDGIDFLEGEAGNDTIDGGDGFDVLDYRCASRGAGFFCTNLSEGQTVDLAAATSTGGQGDDTFVNIESVRGSQHDDVLRGAGGTDYFWPGLGDDEVHGFGGEDYVDYERWEDDPAGNCDTSAGTGVSIDLSKTPQEVTGGQGTDTLTGIEHAVGSAFDDIIIGSKGKNSLWGGCGNDVLRGGGGDDVLEGNEGNNALYGGGGRDVVSYDSFEPETGSQGVRVHLGAGTALADGNDALFSMETVIGSQYGDVLVGSDGADLLIGGAGADQLWGRGGADVLIGNGLPEGGQPDGGDRFYGGSGVDTADFSNAPPGGVVVDLADQWATGDGGTDHLESIEAVRGSDDDDVLRGDANRNLLYGGAGDDTLEGRQGNDYLDGEAGTDTFVGGAGAFDVVDYLSTASQATVDLASGEGTIEEIDGFARTETFGGVEAVGGTVGNDVFRGDGGRNYLAGEGGNDELVGAGGPDFLFGGQGTDDLRGNAGYDECHDGETHKSCEEKHKGQPDWHKRSLEAPREFRATGIDDFLDNLATFIEERRLHRRRLHR